MQNRAPHFDRNLYALPLQLTQARFIHVTRRGCLSLLSSEPDEVHSLTSHGTQPSTSLAKGQTIQIKAQVRNSILLQRIAGYRAPLTPHLARLWRRKWDLNPRQSFPYTRVPGVLLQPLGHLSISHIQKLIKTFFISLNLDTFSF